MARFRRSLPPEGEARFVAERMALLLQASLLLRHAPAAVADLFVATRIAQEGGRGFGSFPVTADTRLIIGRLVAA